ncbi:MAG: TenA family protein [Proteobacteria bacterium]|nr:TenA family protein [Pseudomonadota bacterium]
MDDPSLARRLWQANADWAQKILAHPFVQGLGDGSLPLGRFKSYVAQDAYFLDAFARAYAFCLAHGTSRDDLYGFSELIAGVLEELKLHESYTEKLQISLDGVTPLAATQAYVDFLLGNARQGVLGETIAGMTPCMRLYAYLGQTLAKKDVAPAYADWVSTYSDPGFEALAVRLEALLDRHAVDSPAVRANYRRAMELEYGFFDANR